MDGIAFSHSPAVQSNLLQLGREEGGAGAGGVSVRCGLSISFGVTAICQDLGGLRMMLRTKLVARSGHLEVQLAFLFHHAALSQALRNVCRKQAEHCSTQHIISSQPHDWEHWGLGLMSLSVAAALDLSAVWGWFLDIERRAYSICHGRLTHSIRQRRRTALRPGSAT